jgi:hypothetical protein
LPSGARWAKLAECERPDLRRLVHGRGLGASIFALMFVRTAGPCTSD